MWPPTPEVDASIDDLVAVRELAAQFRKRFSFPVVAVGGSNGKTTTKDLIAAALGPRAAKTNETMNGWSGIPFTLLERRSFVPSALVVEVGIDAVGAMKEHAALVDPDVSVLTMIGPEHLAGLGDVETVAREERMLFTERSRRIVNMADSREWGPSKEWGPSAENRGRRRGPADENWGPADERPHPRPSGSGRGPLPPKPKRG